MGLGFEAQDLGFKGLGFSGSLADMLVAPSKGIFHDMREIAIFHIMRA